MYKERRLALAQLLPENAIALFFSGKAPYKTGDEKYPFSVDRSFYYLSGLDKEHMILVILRINGEVREQLFLEQYDEAVSYTHLVFVLTAVQNTHKHL